MPDLRMVTACVAAMLLLTGSFSLAQVGTALPAAPVTADADVRIAVDISGSMRVNDPGNLRRPAVRLLARLLPDGAGAGLWTFGRDVNMLVGHGSVDDAWRQEMIRASEQINSVALRTNLGGAIEAATDDWFGRDYPGPTHLILLTDGKADIAQDQAANDRERTRIAEELVPALKQAGVVVHTIALSAEADLDLMGLIADATGGSAHIAETAEALSRIFADALGQVVAQDEVPIEGNTFQVDAGVEEFTALIFGNTPSSERSLSLVSPTNSTYSVGSADRGEVAWVADADYDLITISNPAPGDWRVDGDLGTGSRVTVVSDLRMVVTPLPPRFRLGDEVDVLASFFDADTRIRDPDFLGVIEVTLTLITEDGRSGSRVLHESGPPEDGVYRDTIARLSEPGNYQLAVEADGQTFSRKYRQTITLLNPDASDSGVVSAPVVPEGPVETGSAEDERPAVAEPEVEETVVDVIESPIDISQVEVAAPEAAAGDSADPDPEPAGSDDGAESWLDSALAKVQQYQAWIAGGLIGLVAVLAGLFVLVRRRRAAADQTEPGDTTSEPLPVLDENVEEEIVEDDDEIAIPIAEDVAAGDMALPEEEAPLSEPDPASAEPADDESADELRTEPEAPPSEDQDAGLSEEEEDLPRAEEQADVFEEELRRIAEEAEATPEAEDEAPLPDDDEILASQPPSADPDEDVPLDQDPVLDELDESLLDDDHEFGLEDFDLSDIDDLPDLDQESDSDDPGTAPDDNRDEPKKRD